MAGHMMLNNLGETEAADLIERAVMTIVKDNMKSMDAGRMGMGTSEVGDLAVKYVLDEKDGF